MFAWLIPLVGEKAAKPVFFALMAVILLGGGFIVAKCTGGNRQAEKQAEQTNRSGEAISAAASDAIGTITGRTVTDKTVDDAVDQAAKDIGNAEDADTIRNIVIASVCADPSHRNDPACKGK